MIGKIIVYITLIASFISIIGYALTYFRKNNLLKVSRLFFHITVISVLFASAYLLSLILSHQFQYSYVWEYSSRSLGTPLLISTFYAGQEGSFLLWALFASIIGIFLINNVSKNPDFEAPVMMVYTLVIAFLALLLILKSPFTTLWEAFPGQVKENYMPEDGRGLNPILQNFWMVIHPPILFIGFSSLAVPFSFALATLFNKKYKEWVYYVMPWMLFASATLGLGIILGGYWSYGVLGWGGYWAWDPVENSSLIPWLVSIAALHTLIGQKATEGYKKTNIILSILAYLLVLYSTFLTRSGILQDASVHSFVKPGMEVYIALILFISSFVLISIIALAIRFKSLSEVAKKDTKVYILSREAILYIGSLIILASGAIIIAGTSLPIFSKSTVDISFYNQMNMPIAIIMLVFAAIAFFLDWRSTDTKKFLNKLITPAALALVTTIILAIFAINELVYIIFTFVIFFAFFSGIVKLGYVFKTKKFTFGAAVAHIGLALFFLGIIASSKYSEEVKLSLELGKPAEAFGYLFTYTGAEPFDDPQNPNDDKYYFNILVEKDNKEMVLKPVMYFSSFNEGLMKNPDIASFVTKDIYISPIELIAPQKFNPKDEQAIGQNEEKEINGVKIKFIDFDLSQAPMGNQTEMTNYSIFANVDVSYNGKTNPLKLELKYIGGMPEPVEVNLPQDNKITLLFTGMNVKNEQNPVSSAKIVVTNEETKAKFKKQEEIMITSVAIKPFIGVLWLGAFIMIFGFFYSIIKRVKDLKKINS